MGARVDAFSVDRAGFLVRDVVPRRGRPYRHRCSPDAFERVAHAAEEAGDAGFTLEEVAAAEDLPLTQVAVALAFLKERGVVETLGRRNFAGPGVHLDAMTEYHALREIKAS